MSRVWQMSRSCRDIVIIWAMSKLRMSGCAEDNFGQTQIWGSGIENDSSRLTVPSARGDTSCTTGETEKENQGEKMTYWRNRYIFKSNHQNWLLCTVLDNFTLKGWSMSVLTCWDMIGDIIHHVIPITLSLITTNSLYSALLRSCSNTLLHNSEFDRALTFDMIVQNGN